MPAGWPAGGAGCKVFWADGGLFFGMAETFRPDLSTSGRDEKFSAILRLQQLPHAHTHAFRGASLHLTPQHIAAVQHKTAQGNMPHWQHAACTIHTTAQHTTPHHSTAQHRACTPLASRAQQHRAWHARRMPCTAAQVEQSTQRSGHIASTVSPIPRRILTDETRARVLSGERPCVPGRALFNF